VTVRGAVASDARCSPRKRSRSRRRRWHNSQGDTVEEACREVTERGARRTCHSPVATVPSPTDTVSYSSIVEEVVYATVAEQFKRTGKLSQTNSSTWHSGMAIIPTGANGVVRSSIACTTYVPIRPEPRLLGAVSLTNAPSSSSSDPVSSRYLRM
jgi:hypothetical protein